jgi:acetyl esterase/lipase
VRSTIAIVIVVLMLGIAMWTVVPAPTLLTLALAVVVPELALPILGVCAVVTLGCIALARGRGRIAVIVLAAVVLLALAWPPFVAPDAWIRSAATLDARHIPALAVHPHFSVRVDRDIRVPLRDGGALALDLYRPQRPGVLPLIVTIYGGAWIFGSRAGDAPLARLYATRGYAVAVIDYRHAPAYRFPVQIDDVDDALATIARHAAAWHVDATRVALFGRSAGAQLALLAGERRQPLTVRAIVAYYAPTDLVAGWNEPPWPDPVGTKRILTAYLGGPPQGRMALYEAASPLAVAHAGMPPVLAIIGDRDELVRPEFQRRFAARLDALHVENIAIELPWSNHAFDAVNGLGASIAHVVTFRFLDAQLGKGPR